MEVMQSSVLKKIKNIFYKKNNIYLFLLLLTPFIYVESLFDKVGLPRRTYIGLIAAIWFLTWLIEIKNKKFSVNWNILFSVITVLWFFAFISYFWGKENMLYQADLYFYTSLVIICFMSMQINSNSIFKFISVAAVIAALLSVIGILQNFSINPFGFQEIAPPAITFINKNYATNFFDLILPVTFILFLISNNKNEAWRSAFIVSMIATYIILTKTRGAYLSMIVALSILFISIQIFPWLKKQTTLISTLYKKQIIFIIFIPVLFSYLPTAINLYKPNFDENRYTSFFSGAKQDSITSRFYAYDNAFDLIKQNPITGVGLGGFQQNFRPYLQSSLADNKIYSDFIYLHNEPLQLVIELGAIGGGILLLFLIFLLRSSFLSLNLESGAKSDINVTRTKMVHISFVIALIASFFHSIFSFPYHQPASATIMAIWVGFILSLSAKNISLSNLKFIHLGYMLAFTLSLMYLFGIAHFYYKYIESSAYMKQAISQKECNKASELIIHSLNTYSKDYLSQSQGLNIIASCPIEPKIQLLFAENILKSNPTHPWALYLAGISNFKLEKYDSSYKSLKLLSFIYPYFSGTYTLIGHIAIKNKEYPKAREYYEHAVKLAPGNFEAKNLLHQLSEKGY